jgi:hypothetical protein
VTLSRTSAVWATLAVALALSAVHLFAPRIRRRLPLTSQAVTSFGGGVAAAYVFLYLLPRLAEGNQAVAAVLGDKVRSTPLAGLATSLVALLGFVTFYALERVTHRSQRGTAEPTRAVFLVQLAFFAAYSGLMTYTLATKWQAGALAALLFAIAMGLHIFATRSSSGCNGATLPEEEIDGPEPLDPEVAGGIARRADQGAPFRPHRG